MDRKECASWPFEMLSEDFIKVDQVWDNAVREIDLAGEEISEQRLEEIRSRIGKEKGEMGRLEEKWRFDVKVYRQLARRYHPDRNSGDPNANRRM